MSTKQLYEKTSEGMKEVSPLVAIEDIYSKLSDTPLEALVSLYNHVKCEWKGSVADTRRTVPLFLRRSGLFITYNNGTKYITEFFSAGADQITTEGWIKDSNWTSVPDKDYISAGVKPGVGTIGYEQLSDNLKQLFREKVNVTNFPDDEDIISVDNMLKFKDREVDAANFQSKGYVILRKNLVEVNGVVKNILTQDMINQDNTIYDVKYDFEAIDNISFKPNSIVIFNGGSFNDRVSCTNYYGIINNKFVVSDVDFIPTVSSTTNGLMSSTDKINLDLLNTKVPTIENKITDLSDKINNLNSKGDTDSRPTLLDTDEGFEDSAIISKDLSEAMASDVVVKKEINLAKETTVYKLLEPGTHVEEGDIIATIQTPYDEEDANAYYDKMILEASTFSKEKIEDLVRDL